VAAGRCCGDGSSGCAGVTAILRHNRVSLGMRGAIGLERPRQPRGAGARGSVRASNDDPTKVVDTSNRLANGAPEAVAYYRGHTRGHTAEVTWRRPGEPHGSCEDDARPPPTIVGETRC
jgi:hypothetical protein